MVKYERVIFHQKILRLCEIVLFWCILTSAWNYICLCVWDGLCLCVFECLLAWKEVEASMFTWCLLAATGQCSMREWELDGKERKRGNMCMVFVYYVSVRAWKILGGQE